MHHIKTIVWIFVLAVMMVPCFLMGQAWAASLEWDHDGADGFNIYMDGSKVADVADVRTWDIPQTIMDDGVEHSFQVSAFNFRGESDRSNTVILVGKPTAPESVSLVSSE